MHMVSRGNAESSEQEISWLVFYKGILCFGALSESWHHYI